MNLREAVERDLGESLEGAWSLPVTLISPTAVSYSVRGQVLYSSRVFDPDSGAQLIVPNPVVVLRRSTLVRVPADGEKWGVLIPTVPKEDAPLEEYVLDDRPITRSAVGFIRLYLTKVEV